MIEFKLEVPSDLISLRTVQAFVVESANIYGFKDDILKQFSLIAEESFLYAMRLLKYEEKHTQITVKSKADEKYFIVSFLDKGMPFSQENSSSNIEKTEIALIKAYCSKLMWVNHGKNGKELRILFVKPRRDITQYKLPFQEIKDNNISPDNMVIEHLNPNESGKVARLIYKTYGYTYPNEDMYYPEIIKNLNDNAKLISIIAKDRKNDVIAGHYAIEKYRNREIAEFGQAVIDADYRGLGLLHRMRKKVEKTAVEIGLKGIYSQPVTSHIKTQKINDNFGSIPCGISFGLAPDEFDFRKMNIKPLSQRETCLLYFKSLVTEKRTIYPPKKHIEMIEKIYNKLDIPFSIGKQTNHNTKPSIINSRYMQNWGFGVIEILSVGSDFYQKFKGVFTELRYTAKADVIFLNLTISNGFTDTIVDLIESRGFFFSGIAPYILDGKDAVRFEYMNTFIDTSKIKVSSDFGNEILSYCGKKMKEAIA